MTQKSRNGLKLIFLWIALDQGIPKLSEAITHLMREYIVCMSNVFKHVIKLYLAS